MDTEHNTENFTVSIFWAVQYHGTLYILVLFFNNYFLAVIINSSIMPSPHTNIYSMPNLIKLFTGVIYEFS
jgi:hypothetical protein